MRIPIREQLGLLVLLVSLIALMVLALAVVPHNPPHPKRNESLLIGHSGFKVMTLSLTSGKMPCGNVLRRNGLMVSQGISSYLDRLLESGGAFCDSATVPVPGAIDLNPDPRSDLSRSVEQW